MKPDRSKNDLIMLGAVGVLGVLAIGMVVAAVMERDIPEALSSLSVGVLGAVAGYVTAGRSSQQEPQQPKVRDREARRERRVPAPVPVPTPSEVEQALEAASTPQESGTRNASGAVQLELEGMELPEVPAGYEGTDPGVASDPGPEFGSADDDWFDDDEENDEGWFGEDDDPRS